MAKPFKFSEPKFQFKDPGSSTQTLEPCSSFIAGVCKQVSLIVVSSQTPSQRAQMNESLLFLLTATASALNETIKVPKFH